MDEKKDGRKKESIDEILSDLNGLLNKMPGILEGIKLPEFRPAEPEAAARPPAGQPPSGEQAVSREDSFEKTLEIDPGEFLPAAETAPAPAAPAPEEKENLKVQSLGEFMFSPDQQGPQEPAAPRVPIQAEPLALPIEPAGLDSAPALPEIRPSAAAEEAPAAAPHPAPAAGETDPLATESSQASLMQEPDRAKEEGPAAASASEDGGVRGDARSGFFESTRDFGVPDIDAMLQLSGGGAAPAAQPAPVGEPKPAVRPAPEPASGGTDGLENFIITPGSETASGKGGEMESNEEPSKRQEDLEITIPDPEEAAAQAAPPAGQEPQAAAPEIKSAPEIEFPAQPPAASAERSAAVPALDDGTLVVQPPVSGPGPDFQPSAEVVLQPSGDVPAAEPQAAQAASEGAAAAQTPSDGPEPGFQPHAEVTLQAPETLQEASAADPAQAVPAEGDSTMVIPPPEIRGEERTVIYEAGAAPAQASPADLAALSEKQAPEGVAEDRVRTVAFMYAPEDPGLCAELLAEMDAVCLRSPTAPMFVKRAFVEACAAGSNGNVVMQKVTDSKAAGLVCLGAVPQETLYEIENVFTAAGVFYRHLSREHLNRTAVLDLVMEFILR